MRALLALLPLVCVCTSTQARTITHGRFEGVRIVAPSQRVEQFVLLLADGAEEGTRLATTLASQGALVATIETRALFAALERDGAECVSPNGDLENLAHYVQAMEHLDSYHTPLLVGAGAGAPFVYAMLAQSPADTFAGGMSVRFCPQLALRKPLCEGQHLKYESRARNTLTPARLERPWKVLGVAPAACADAARTFAAQAGAPIEPVDGSGPSYFLRSTGTWEQMQEYFVHRSLYHLKEGDPHAWAIPRLTGLAKAAFVAVEFDEFGGGRGDHVHQQLFADLMVAAGLDASYLGYIDAVPAESLAVVNLMSLFGLHREHRGAAIGHFASTEITSSPGSRRLVDALERLGAQEPCVRFYREHVEADAVHEQVVRTDVVGDLVGREPALDRDVIFGIRAHELVEDRLADHLMRCWTSGRSSLRRPLDC